MSDDILFGAIAVREGFITPEQLSEAIEQQRASKTPARIGEILLARGFLTESNIQTLLDIQRIVVADRAESAHAAGLFGQIAIKGDFCTPDQVTAAVRAQSELAATGRKIRLGQIMIQAGTLTPDQVAEILRQQEKYFVRCPGCLKWYFVEGLGQTLKLFCHQCLRLNALPVLPGGNADAPEFMRHEAEGKPVTVVTGEAGECFGPFRIESEIMRAVAMVVLRAVHLPSGRLTTLRILHANQHPLRAELDRFRESAQPLLQLSHPNIAEYVDVGDIEERPYVATEYLDGATFASTLARRDVQPAELLRFLEKAARTAADAHAQGVVHGGLKPANLLIGHQFEPRIIDFGLGPLLASQPFLKHGNCAVTAHTPPEELSERPIDQRSDVYALGVVLYEILSGRSPFSARGPTNLREAILAGRQQPLESDVPPAWHTICAKATAVNHRDRYATAEALANDIRRATERKPPLARRPASRRWIVAATGSVLLAVAAGILIWLLTRGNDEPAPRTPDDRPARASSRYRRRRRRRRDTSARGAPARDR
ncbi:MAG: protein kinase [Planctomycetes bacterium]|nr:protein kinase [Planctomycetota bacterium]